MDEFRAYCEIPDDIDVMLSDLYCLHLFMVKGVISEGYLCRERPKGKTGALGGEG